MSLLFRSATILLLSILTLISCSSDSNPTNSEGDTPSKTFIRVYGGSDIDYARDIVPTDDGGYVIVGKTHSSNGDFSDTGSYEQKIYAMKINSEGDKDWVQTLSGSGVNRGNTIISTSDDGFLISGMTSSNDGDFSGMNEEFRDRFLIKLSSTGEEEWVEIIGGNGTDWGEGHTIDEMPDGGFVMTGHTSSTDGDFEDVNNNGSNPFVLKVNSNGIKDWVKIFNDEINGSGRSLDVSNTGEIFITGYTVNNDDNRDIYLMKLNSSGDKEWVRKFGGNSHDFSYSVTTDDNNGIVITGYTESTDGDFENMNNGEQDMFMLKTNSSGETSWTKTVGGTRLDMGTDIITTNDGNYIVTGYTESTDDDFSIEGNGRYDVFIMKINQSGEKIWINRFGGSDRERSYAVIQDSNNNLMGTGQTSSNDGNFDNLHKGETDIFIMKLNENGEID